MFKPRLSFGSPHDSERGRERRGRCTCRLARPPTWCSERAGQRGAHGLGVQAQYVALHVRLLPGRVGAVGARERPLPGMGQHVLLQVLVPIAAAERLAACGTRGNPLRPPHLQRHNAAISVTLTHTHLAPLGGRTRGQGRRPRPSALPLPLVSLLLLLCLSG